MSLIVLYENPLASPDQLATWSFSNAASHRDINRVIFGLTGDILPDFVLDPFDPRDMTIWLYQHALMHNAQNAVLGIAGFNLSNVNWGDQADLDAWLWNHGQEHYQAAAILELG